MKRKIFFIFIKVFSISVLLVSNTKAEDTEKLTADEIKKRADAFIEDPSIQTFDRLPKANRDIIASEILTEENEKSTRFSAEEFRIRKKTVLAHHLSSIDAEEQKSLYKYAFLVMSREPETSHMYEYLALATEGKPDLIHDSICDAFEEISNDPATHSDRFEKLLPLVQQYPEVINQNCIGTKLKDTYNFNIADIIYSFDAKAAFNLKNQKGKALYIQNTNDSSFCTEEQLKKYFSESISTMLKFKKALKHLISINDKDCKIHGLIQKDANGSFTFQKNFALPGKNKPTFTFVSLKEIVDQFKTTQSKESPPIINSNGGKADQTVGPSKKPDVRGSNKTTTATP